MDQKFCTQCGALLPETGAFCPECGARTQRETQAPAPAAAPSLAVTPAMPARRPPQSARRPLPLLLTLLTAVVVVGATVYFLAIRPRQTPASVGACVAGEDCAGTTVADVHDENGIPYPDVQRISVADARARYDAGQVTFIDVRDAEAYAAAHIPESLLIPLEDLEVGIPPLPREAQIITYCT